MEETIERNDVDISRIFDWGRVYEVISPDSGEVVSIVYMKLLGDADLSRARVYALRKSSELRRKLRDENSDERVAYVRNIDEMTEEELVNMLSAFSYREIANTAKKAVKVKKPVAPKSDAPLEKMEKYQRDVDNYPKKIAEALTEAIQNELEKFKEKLLSQSREENYKLYLKMLVDEFCEREAMDAFKTMQVFLGCYKDDTYKTKYFSSFEEFDNLEPTVKQNFKDAYDSIDIDMSELKKLRLATQ